MNIEWVIGKLIGKKRVVMDLKDYNELQEYRKRLEFLHVITMNKKYLAPITDYLSGKTDSHVQDVLQKCDREVKEMLQSLKDCGNI